jgi:hypothetical protein
VQCMKEEVGDSRGIRLQRETSPSLPPKPADVVHYRAHQAGISTGTGSNQSWRVEKHRIYHRRREVQCMKEEVGDSRGIRGGVAFSRSPTGDLAIPPA